MRSEREENKVKGKLPDNSNATIADHLEEWMSFLFSSINRKHDHFQKFLSEPWISASIIAHS